MFTVYVLYSKIYNKIYIGYSSNIAERLKSHNDLRTKGWTIRYRPWELLYTEVFEEKKSAMQRDKELKSYRGSKYIRTLL